MWITRCLAEAAEAAEETAATAAQVSGGLDIIHIALIGVGLYLLITGILTAVTKKFYGGLEKGYEKYTPESVQSCMTIIGLQNVLVGSYLIIAGVGRLVFIPFHRRMHSAVLIKQIRGLRFADPFFFFSCSALSGYLLIWG